MARRIFGPRRCTSCGEVKAPSEFYPRGQLGHRRSRCKACTRRELDAKPRTPAQLRVRKLKREWGLTVAEYEAILEEQDGGCAICHARASADGRRLAIDHHHDSGLIRGLLCSSCNTAIGALRERAELFHAAVAYLERPPAQRALGERVAPKQGSRQVQLDLIREEAAPLATAGLLTGNEASDGRKHGD